MKECPTLQVMTPLQACSAFVGLYPWFPGEITPHPRPLSDALTPVCRRQVLLHELGIADAALMCLAVNLV